MMKRIDRVLVVIFLLSVSIFLLMITVDTVSIIIDPTEHKTSYVFIESRENWFERSIKNYIIGNILYLWVGSGLFYIGIKKLKNNSDKKIWNVLFYICFVAVILSITYGYNQWAETGFDH